MKLCFVIDARSPIAQNWVRYFIDQGHEVHIISSYPCDDYILPGSNLRVIPLGLSGLSRIKHDGSIAERALPSVGKSQLIKPLLAQIRSGRLSFLSRFLIDWLVPLDLYRQVSALRQEISSIQPDLVHAMRIPREGIAAALATPPTIPLILSIWGNDFTLWAQRNPLRGHQTRRAVQRADAIHSDCYRDMRLAEDWGFDSNLPELVVPGAGGIHMRAFQPMSADNSLRDRFQIPPDAVVLLNPRGIREYVRNEVFFAALHRLVQECENIRVICTGMQNNPVVEDWIIQYKLQPWVTLLPMMSHEDMAALYQVADISVSPSQHDGTPNTLLEAMACGCFIVAGDIESIREWINHEENGLLCDPADQEALGAVLIEAVQNVELRQRAARINRKLIEERADYQRMMPKVTEFYHQVRQHKQLTKRVIEST